MPPDVNVYDSSLMASAEQLACSWVASDSSREGATPPEAAPSDMHDWPVDAKLAFVTKLAQFSTDKPLHKDMTRQLNKLYGFDSMQNPEVRLCAIPGFLLKSLQLQVLCMHI
jgi:hypothetical protein